MLHFFHNTVVSLRSGNTTLLRLSTDGESADARNNLLYVAAGGDRLAMLDADGVLALSHNWTKPGWVSSHGGLSGVIDDDDTGIQGASPGFVDAGMQDFHLLSTSQALDAGGERHPDVLPVNVPAAQYREPQGYEPRPTDGLPDLGAFELPEPGIGAGYVAGLVLLGAWSRPRARFAGDSVGIGSTENPAH